VVQNPFVLHSFSFEDCDGSEVFFQLFSLLGVSTHCDRIETESVETPPVTFGLRVLRQYSVYVLREGVWFFSTLQFQ